MRSEGSSSLGPFVMKAEGREVGAGFGRHRQLAARRVGIDSLNFENVMTLNFENAMTVAVEAVAVVEEERRAVVICSHHRSIGQSHDVTVEVLGDTLCWPVRRDLAVEAGLELALHNLAVAVVVEEVFVDWLQGFEVLFLDCRLGCCCGRKERKAERVEAKSHHRHILLHHTHYRHTDLPRTPSAGN